MSPSMSHDNGQTYRTPSVSVLCLSHLYMGGSIDAHVWFSDGLHSGESVSEQKMSLLP